ncbi:MarR family winged helix-turn-helix transcriptional regulator [Yinghuangia sp. ASG 101]|uniref:MarR family winged helix-turn-helix transcriptional regulator n=1 Tax=Yinghuangia sp. ASG 101 TaxID=2896848 RepID=UPI001E591479|nr:MarR family winged helix-turn-helix transcriptional regulator [Yinghuangia sp. ASG 101]UGQ13763.1 MarR family winged helix-turn-helix transcriptional regulator [Yinghuangia sp. ASG 101]
MSGDLLDRSDCSDCRRGDGRGDARGRGDDREASVETLRYALNGFLSAVRADRLARASGSDSPQVQRHRVLVTLADELDLDSAGLADVLGMRPAHVTGLLDTLGREGLVEGVRAGRGRGSPVARLTPAGLRALDELDTVFRRHWESAVADLPAGDLSTAARVISRLTGVIIPTR